MEELVQELVKSHVNDSLQGKIKELTKLINYSFNYSKIPVSIFTREQGIVYTTSPYQISISMDDSHIFNYQEKTIQLWNTTDYAFFASFTTLIDNSLTFVVIGPKMLAKPEKTIHRDSHANITKDALDGFKEWVTFVYHICNPNHTFSFIEDINVTIELPYFPVQEIENQKVQNILYDRESKHILLIIYIIRFMYTSQVDNMLQFLDKYIDTLYPYYSEDYIQSLKYNVIILLTLLTRELITVSSLDTLKIRAMGELFASTIDKQTTKEEVIFALKQILLEYSEIFKDYKKYSAHIQETLQLINRDIYNDVSVSEICATLHLDPSYLSTLFKKEMGISMKEYIQTKRIEEAKLLLKYTDNSISEISKLLNFCSVSYFAKVFKRYVGIPPKEYKSKNVIHI